MNAPLDAFVESTLEAVVVVDARGCVVVSNAPAERIFGYSIQELRGRKFDELVPEPFKEVPLQQWAEHMAASRVRPMMDGPGLVARRKDGSTFGVEVSPTLLNTEEGLHVACIVRDVTDARRLQDLLLQAQKLEVVGRLAAGVVHEFNNILTIISGYTDLLITHLNKDSQAARRDAEHIQTTLSGANALARRLLSIARKQVAQPKPVDINALVRSLEDMVRRVIGDDIELILRLDRNIRSVQGDAEQIEQILMSLVLNARDAMSGGGRLTIETAIMTLAAKDSGLRLPVSPGPYVVLQVADTGHGMDEPTKERMFEPFFTTRKEGTGLGLSTVLEMLNQSGGNVAVESEPGRGTKLRIYFPCSECAETAFPTNKRVTEVVETILLVIVEPALRRLMRQMLEESGYTVLEAAHSEEAISLSRAFSKPVHLLLTDVVMPVMNGRDLARVLVELRPDLKVLFVSGYADTPIVQYGILGAGLHFLQKPFTAEVLLAKVREVLSLPPQTAMLSPEATQAMVLVADPDETIRGMLSEFLESRGCSVLSARDADQAIHLLEANPWIGVVLIDLRVPPSGGLFLMLEIKKRKLSPTAVIMGSASDVQMARYALELGAFDSIRKPVELPAVETIVTAALGHTEYERRPWWKRLT